MNTSVLYEPKGRAREYAALACNTYRGCDHNCTYCYAPAATRRDREAFAQPTTRGPDFLKKLERDAAVVAATGTTERVLLCFTTDPYCHLDVTEKVTREAIKILHGAGLNVQVLTKGGTRALRDIDLFGPGDAFATTLTCTDEAERQVWEPNAAPFCDRLDTIRDFHAAGIPTWVSLEPVLSARHAMEIINCTHPWVDFYKVGKMHYRQMDVDWKQFGCMVSEHLSSLGKAYYLKNDLRAEMERS